MPSSIIITHLSSSSFSATKTPAMSFKSPEHSTPTELVSAVGSLQEGSLYWENFISIKQLHGNSRTAQGDPPAKLPSCLSLFLGTSEWRGYPVSHLSERRERDSQYLSINWLALRQQNQPDLNLKSPLSLFLSHFGLKSGSTEQSKYPEKCQLSSDWVWSDGHITDLPQS